VLPGPARRAAPPRSARCPAPLGALPGPVGVLSGPVGVAPSRPYDRVS